MRRGLEEDGYMILSVTFGTAWERDEGMEVASML